MNATGSEKSDSPIENTWRKTRHGAWAARGFHYQHLISTLIVTRQWAGLAPTGLLIPEGIEDAVIETHDTIALIQAKSRLKTPYSENEVSEILREVLNKSTTLPNTQNVHAVAVLESCTDEISTYGIDRLFDDESEKVLVCPSPRSEILDIFIHRLDVAPAIAEGLIQEIYDLVVSASVANASKLYHERVRISTTEVERRINNRLEAEDPSAIEKALLDGVVAPVDFATPLEEPGFYRGVSVKPGHVAAGLLIDRPKDVRRVIDTLKRRKQVLLAGPSGAGKSALSWLTAAHMAKEMRWFEVTSIATTTNVADMIRFIRSRNPTKYSPIAIVIDDVANDRISVWNTLSRELLTTPHVFILGSIRNENTSQVINQSEAAFVLISLDDKLAETIWRKLTSRQETTWTHWQEPFEQSDGLLLEYVHLLTSGRRLKQVIRDQIVERELEGRDDELAIIRLTSVLASFGGDVVASKVFEHLQLRPDDARRAMKRLVDEHLVLESKPGVIGGLHPLRSTALVETTHDETVFTRLNSLEQCIVSATPETLPRVIQSIFIREGEKERDAVVKTLIELLSHSHDLVEWAAVFTGLGLATIENHLDSFTRLLEKFEVPRAFWATASVIYSSDIDLRELSKSKVSISLQSAFDSFRNLEKVDLRTNCLTGVLTHRAFPICDSLNQANRLLAALVPLCEVGPKIRELKLNIRQDSDSDIREIASLLSTAYAVNPDLARNLVDQLGGQQELLNQFRLQTPWVTKPNLLPDEEYGRTIRCDWLSLDQSYRPDTRDSMRDICERLLALVPDADAVASDAIDASGNQITFNEFNLSSKKIPRRNLPSRVQIAWNVVFRQLMLARASSKTLTEYSSSMVGLVRKTERIFRSFTEKMDPR